MMQEQTQSRDEAVDGILNNVGPETDSVGLPIQTDEWSWVSKECNRWTKYGNDRLYFNDGSDGYIDLNEGGVHGDTPVVSVDVDQEAGRVVYYAQDIDEEYAIASRDL